MKWLQNQFENHRLFRRLLLIYCCVLVWAATHWAFNYAAGSGLPGVELAAVITAIQAPVTLLLGYFVKLYSASVSNK